MILRAWIVALAAASSCAAVRCRERSAADERWTDTRQVGPFIFHATFPLRPTSGCSRSFPQLQRELTRTLGVPPAKNPIYVYLFSDEDAISRVQGPALSARSVSPGAVHSGRRLAGRVHVPQAGPRNRRAPRVHARAVAFRAAGRAAVARRRAWPSTSKCRRTERAFDHPYFDDLKWKWSLRLGMVRSIESLEQRNDLTEMDAADYRFSWAWVHFMLHGPEPAHRALVEYLACYQQYEPAGQAFGAARGGRAEPHRADDSAFQALA